MAYYPGDYQYLADCYSHNLFSFSTSSPLSLSDPYAYTYTPYDQQSYDREDDHQHQRQRQHRPRSPPAAIRPSSASTPLPDRYSSPPFVAPRSSSPPPPPALTENTPSESYLNFSLIPSTTLSSPTPKLVVLDLNGTLLLRSPRPPRSARGQPHPGPVPRRVLPRPYFPALRSYFFAPRTRAWLDVMVWSSAQPHSVDDMIQHTFGNDREKLIAVWARDTLGLTEDHYHRKVQTIKDLEKPWAALDTPDQGRASPSSIASSRSASSKPTSSSPYHSAATTILLDDSHAKAVRQPYNHLCVPEYSRALRNADLAALAAHPPTDAPLPADLETTAQNDEEAHHEGKGRKRKRDKQQKQELEKEDGEGLDETLLAVIGILHAARLQSSVAGWLRAGALIQPRRSQSRQPQLERGSEWFDHPVLVRQWAQSGREAMRELGLVIEHGVKP